VASCDPAVRADLPSQHIDYNKVDWDESLDVDDDREAQERWFDEDDDE